MDRITHFQEEMVACFQLSCNNKEAQELWA